MSRVALELARIAEVVATVRDAHPDDDDLLSDMLEGETDLHALLEWAGRKVEAERARAAAAREQAKARTSRAKRFDARAERLVGLCMALMEAADTEKVETVAFTFSVRGTPRKVVVTDLDALPEVYVRVKREADKTALGKVLKAGEAVPGATLGNGGVALQIRSS